MMWRGAATGRRSSTARTMIVAGGIADKLVLYPIGKGETPRTQLTNWVVTIASARQRPAAAA